MATLANPFQNRENYGKYLALYFEPGLTVLLTTLEWCSKGQRPIQEHLADLGATNSDRKKNNINATEQNTLEELKIGISYLNDLDITLIYKIIQLTCNLLPIKDVVPGELEHLLLELKNGRNLLGHPGKEQKNITDQMVEDKCKEMKDLLTKLLQAAATKGNVGLDVLKMALDEIEDNIQKIKSGKNICDSISPQTFQLIVEGLRSNESSNDQLKEIEEYSAPKLKKEDDFQPLKDILQLNKSSVIVVQGEAGMGKTAMSRFLFNSWLSGNMDSVEGLSSFDVVIRVGCNQINDRDINLFYERLFPTSFSFTNTNSFKKSLDEFKVFWIMDGFDECTKEFKGFLTAMAKSLSKKHKLLITTRPNTYKDLKEILCECKRSIISLTLELLQNHNVDEIIHSLITEDKKKETFKIQFHNLDLLKTPLNLELFIKLWMQNPELVRDTYTTKMLYLRTIYHNLSILKKKLKKRTRLSKDDLKRYLKKWFFGSLCKQSFLMLMQNRLNLISEKDLDTLKDNACKCMLDPSMCLSTFLVQMKKNDLEDEGECKNDDDSEEWENEEEDKGESENDGDDEEWENEEEDKGESENDGDDEEWENEEEDKGKFRYEFHHLTQQFILASLFLKHFKDYDGENVIKKSISITFVEFVQRLIEFYVEMIREDGSLDTNLKQVFSPIQSIIMNHFDLQVTNKSYLWFISSVASNFNEEYMKEVSKAFKDFPYLDIDGFIVLYDFDSLVLINLTKFLEFVSPQKIILRYESLASRLEDFQPLLEFLINSKLEIEFQTSYANEEVFHISDNAFCGPIRTFSYYFFQYKDKWTEQLKTICIKENDELDEYHFFRTLLKELKALERLEIWINLDSFLIPTKIIKKLPKKMVEITTIGLISLNIENFENVLEKLNKMKVEETLKFKALIHDFEDISETDKRQLQKIAHTVSIDFICQCKKEFIATIDKFNITSFVGDVQMLNALNAHHANLKSVFLSIENKWELFRTLKFLRDYQDNLDEVKIKLYPNFPELVKPRNRTSAIPQQLVQRTTISIFFIYKDNFDDYFMLLNNLKGDETLKFKAVYTDHKYLKHHQLEMLNQITGNSSCREDFDNDSQRYFI